MPPVPNFIRHLRPFLKQRQWNTLCVALHLPSLTTLTKKCEDLTSLDPKRKSDISGNSSRAQSQPTTFFRDGAYLINRRHLHISLPCREEGQPPMGGTDAAQLIERVFTNLPRPTLVSLHLHLQIPIEGLANILSAVSALLHQHAASLETLSLSCDFVLHLRQVSSRIYNTAAFSSAPPALGTPHLIKLSDRPAILDFRGVFMPSLIYLNLALPVAIDDTTHFAKLATIKIKHFCYDELKLWCRGIPQVEEGARELSIKQLETYDTLLKQCNCTVQALEIAGDLSSRREVKLFASFNFFPKLHTLSLGWTCEEEIRQILQALLPSKVTLRDILRFAQSHPTLYRGLQLVYEQIKWNETALNTSLSNSTVVIDTPPQLPSLRRLSFSGPMRMGLSNLHLDLYTLVNQNSGRGVHFQYGLFSANARRVLEFRTHFCKHPFFCLYRDIQSRLHHLYIKGITEDQNFSSTTNYGHLARRASVEAVTNDWTSLLKYSYVRPDTRSRQLYRVLRVNSRMQRQMTCLSLSQWNPDCRPPLVGPEMTAFDLFELEMWHLPLLCHQEFGEEDQAITAWHHCLSDTDRSAWESSVEVYKIARMQPGPLSFENVLPWWQEATCIPT